MAKLTIKQRRLAQKYEIKTTRGYWKREGFDTRKEFWDIVYETDAIERAREKVVERRIKRKVKRITGSIFKSVLKKAEKEEARRRVSEHKADYYYDKVETQHTLEYRFKDRNADYGIYFPSDVYDCIIHNATTIEAALNEQTNRKGIKAKISVAFWLVKDSVMHDALDEKERDDWEHMMNTKQTHFHALSASMLSAIALNKQLFFSRPDIDYETLYQSTNKGSFIARQALKIEKLIDEHQEGGSGYTIVSIAGAYLNIVTGVNPISGSSYLPLPKWLDDKHCCYNPDNKDDKCAMWALKVAKYHHHFPKNKHRVSQYKNLEKKLKDPADYSMLTYPTPLEDWKKYERKNDETVIILGLDGGRAGFAGTSNEAGSTTIVPLHMSQYKSRKGTTIVLLLIEDESPDGVDDSQPVTGNEVARGTCGPVRHYVYVNDLSKLLSHEWPHNGKAHYCFNCLGHFWSEECLKNHQRCCLHHEACQTHFPKEGTVMKFKNHRHQQWCPHIVLADSEAFGQKLDGVAPDTDHSFTDAYSRHKGSGYSYLHIHCPTPEEYKVVEYKQFDNVNGFIQALDQLSKRVKNEVQRNIKMNKLTAQQQREFDNARVCHICGEQFKKKTKKFTNKKTGEVFTKETWGKVRDHDHATGEYRGAAHNRCNLNYNLAAFKLPVLFHNFERYDVHLVMNELDSIEEYKLSPVARTKEQYMQLGINQFVIKDSCKHLTASLDSLVQGLSAKQFKAMEHKYPDKGQRDILLRKGVFPYDWWDSQEKRSYPCIPPRKAFYNKLNNEEISTKDYLHAKRVFKKFNLQNMGQYHDLYLQSDVFLLADVFMNYRQESFKSFGLDPVWYMTLPQYAFDAALKYTKAELELLSDREMYLMVEAGIRGGNSMIAHRHAAACNPKLQGVGNYVKHPDKVNTWAVYLDANNLYGWAMSQLLPTGGFQWLQPEQFPSPQDIMGMSLDSKHGLILEVDLEYPKELHRLHRDYPLAVERMKVTKDMLSPYAQGIAKSFKANGLDVTAAPTEKLIGNLCDKERYVVHYATLKLYLEQGLKIKKIHRVVRFNQSAWLKPFIDFNTNKRAEANTQFLKDFYKLMNNAVFGKTMENVRNRINFKLYYNQDKLVKKAKSRLDFKDIAEFNDKLTGILYKKTQVTLAKPIYVGFSILDLSKKLMYGFHYNVMLKKYKRIDLQLLFTDTDSLCYLIRTENVYSDLLVDDGALLKHFDTSNFSEAHPCYSKLNKKIPGLMKFETAAAAIEGFVGLRSKMYAFCTQEPFECGNEKVTQKSVAKGVKGCRRKQTLHYHTYMDILDRQSFMLTSMNLIRSSMHQLSSVTLNKVSLSCYDDKRYILKDGITSIPYGYQLAEGEEEELIGLWQ